MKHEQGRSCLSLFKATSNKTTNTNGVGCGGDKIDFVHRQYVPEDLWICVKHLEFHIRELLWHASTNSVKNESRSISRKSAMQISGRPNMQISHNLPVFHTVVPTVVSTVVMLLFLLLVSTVVSTVSTVL